MPKKDAIHPAGTAWADPGTVRTPSAEQFVKHYNKYYA